MESQQEERTTGFTEEIETNIAQLRTKADEHPNPNPNPTLTLTYTPNMAGRHGWSRITPHLSASRGVQSSYSSLGAILARLSVAGAQPRAAARAARDALRLL